MKGATASVWAAAAWVVVSAGVTVAQPVRIGGWGPGRGNFEGSLTGPGSGWTTWLAEFADGPSRRFPDAVVVTTDELTPQYLAGIDLLLITAVGQGGNVQTVPLSAQEQSALRAWVDAGGRAFLELDNRVGFGNASDAMIAPFGMTAGGLLVSLHTSTVLPQAPACSPVRGPFGAVPQLEGGWPTWIEALGTATPLAAWDSNQTVSLAIGAYGSGRVVFLTDATEFDGDPGTHGATARANALMWLGFAPQTLPATADGCAPGASVVLSLPFADPPGATYQWYRNDQALQGQTGSTLTLTPATIMPGSYRCAIGGVECPFSTAPAVVRACCGADIGRQGGLEGPDGALDNNDFVVFIDWFFSARGGADVGSTGGVPGADGQWNNNDFVVFIDAFFGGC